MKTKLLGIILSGLTVLAGCNSHSNEVFTSMKTPEGYNVSIGTDADGYHLRIQESGKPLMPTIYALDRSIDGEFDIDEIKFADVPRGHAFENYGSGKLREIFDEALKKSSR